MKQHERELMQLKDPLQCTDISSEVDAESRPGAEKMYRSINKMLSPDNYVSGSVPESSMKGGKRRGVPVKTLKKLLKKAGLKTTGKKAALTRRAKKARLMKGGNKPGEPSVIADDASEIAKDIKTEIEVEDSTNKTIPPATTGEMGEMQGGRKRKSRAKKGMGMYGY